MAKIPTKRMLQKLSILAIAAVTLAACDENGQFVMPTPQAQADTAPVPINAPNQPMSERDVERPDIFEVTDRGLWDGRPSLGGVWVAHPDVQDPDRVVIRNAENGREITGALFRRERENPGPLLQISSDAAESLGVLPGAPTELSVVVLRREEVAADPAQNPVVESLDAPVSVAEEALEPAEVAEPEPVAVAAPIVIDLPPAVEAATTAVEQTALAGTAAAAAIAPDIPVPDVSVPEADIVDVSSVIAPAPIVAPADGPRAQVGVFSIEANANAAAAQINDAGIAAGVSPETMGGRTVWRVIAGPLVDESGVNQLKALGFVDAYIAPEE
jgi:rare lipoprotein A